MTISPSLLLIFVSVCASISAAGQNAPSPKERNGPEEWVEAPSSKADPALWECAGYGGSWVVDLQRGSVRIRTLSQLLKDAPLPPKLKVSTEMVGRHVLIRTADGWLVGFDAGEFGGGLWWFNEKGDENRKLLSENVHAIFQTPAGIFILSGLAHLSLNSGTAYRFTETAEEVAVKPVADLGGSPEAATLDASGRVIIATPKSVLALNGSGQVRKLYSSGEDLTYPTSVAVDGNGSIFTAMRFFVLELVPGQNDEYQPHWLMPKKCQSFKVIKRICKLFCTRLILSALPGFLFGCCLECCNQAWLLKNSFSQNSKK